MSRAGLVAALCLLLAGCAGRRQPAASTAPKTPAATNKLTFRWTLPAAAVVTETRKKKGNEAVLRYLVSACPLGEGGMFALRAADHEFIRVNGFDAGTPHMVAALSEATAMARAVPTLVISADGKVFDIVGMPQAVESTLAALEKGGRDPAVVERAGKRLRSPVVMEQLKEKFAESWYVWVGTWLDFDATQGRQEVAGSVMLAGSEISSPIVFEHLGPAKGEPGAVRLHSRSTLEGPEASSALVRLLTEMQSVPAGAEDKLQNLILARQVDLELISDPATMLPRRAHSTARVTVRVPGEAESKRVDEHDYQFAWQSPGHAKAACSDMPPPN